MNHTTNTNHLAHAPWNKGKLIGQKLPLNWIGSHQTKNTPNIEPRNLILHLDKPPQPIQVRAMFRHGLRYAGSAALGSSLAA